MSCSSPCPATDAAPSPAGSGTTDTTLIGSPEPFTNTDYSDAIVYAILTGNRPQAMALAASGALISISDSWATYEACIQGPEMINALVANPNIELNRVIPGQMGDKTIHFLLRTPANRFPGGKKCSIQRLVQCGASPLDCDRHGNTALHILAAHCGDVEHSLMGTFLQTLDSSNVDRKNSMGHTALAVAALNDNVPCWRLLIQHGADPRHQNGDTPMSVVQGQLRS